MNLEEVKALLLHLHEELFLSLGEVVLLIDGHLASHASRIGQLLLERSLLCLGGWIWHNTLSSEVVEHLAWDLLQSFLGKLHWVVLEVPEGHKLNNIRRHLLSVPG